MINTDERIVRALERIADALERYNRAVLCPVIHHGTTQIYEGQILEEPFVQVGGKVSVEGEFAETSR